MCYVHVYGPVTKRESISGKYKQKRYPTFKTFTLKNKETPGKTVELATLKKEPGILHHVSNKEGRAMIQRLRLHMEGSKVSSYLLTHALVQPARHALVYINKVS